MTAVPAERARRCGLPVREARAKDDERRAALGAPVLELLLGIGAAPGTRRLRIERPRLGDALAGAVAIHAARADIDDALRHQLLLLQHREQIRGARITLASRRRRRAMQQGIGRAKRERYTMVEVEAGLPRMPGDGVARREQRRRAARDVAVAHDEETLHAAILFAEIGLTDARIVEELGGAPGKRDGARLHDITPFQVSKARRRVRPNGKNV